METDKLIEVLAVCSGRNALKDCRICPYRHRPNCQQQLIEDCWFQIKNDKEYKEEQQRILSEYIKTCKAWAEHCNACFEDLTTFASPKITNCRDCIWYDEDKSIHATYCFRGSCRAYAKPDGFCTYGISKEAADDKQKA